MKRISARRGGLLAFVATVLLAGALFPVTALAAGTRDMYRMYNPNSGEHFYTAEAAERNSLAAAGWKYEGVGWVAPESSDVPVYRLYSGTDHHYTASAEERDQLVAAGWKYEGVGWYSGGDVPVYRQFNPNVNPAAPTNNSGSHNYTTSAAENDQLVAAGWRAEGVGWYAEGAGRGPTADELASLPKPPAQQPSNPGGSGSGGSGSGSGGGATNPTPAVVYWVSGGSVYHTTPDCPSLKRSHNIKSGSIQQAIAAGKGRVCRNCS